MITCFRCIALGVGGRVLSYYEQLKLEPWEVFAEKGMWARGVLRQSGRTTHELLETIALCVALNEQTFSVSSIYLQKRAYELITALNLPIRISVTRPVMGEAVIYKDHYLG